MARLTVEIELDWLTEDGSVDAAVKAAIVDSIVDKLADGVEDRIEAEAHAKISSTIDRILDKKVDEISQTLLEKRFDLTDQWGDVIAKDTTVMEQLKKRLENFLTEKVNRDGRPSNFDGRPRLEYILERQIDHRFKHALDTAASDIKKRLEKYIEDQLKAQIGESVAQLIGLKDIVKKLPSDGGFDSSNR